MPVAIQYVEHSIEDVLDYFTEEFKCQQGEKVTKYEHFIDPVKGKVIFKLYVERAPKPKKKKTR